MSRKRSRLVLTQDELRDIAETAVECKTSDPEEMVQHLRKYVCMDMEPFEGLVGVEISYDFHRGGSWDGGRHLLKRAWLEEIEAFKDLVFDLGEVNGKHSEVRLAWKDMNVKVESDPYELAKHWTDVNVRLPSFMEYGDEFSLYNLILNLDDIETADISDYSYRMHYKDIARLQFKQWLQTESMSVPRWEDYKGLLEEEAFKEVITNMQQVGWLQRGYE
jgi:hypothetical protein